MYWSLVIHQKYQELMVPGYSQFLRASLSPTIYGLSFTESDTLAPIECAAIQGGHSYYQYVGKNAKNSSNCHVIDKILLNGF